MMPRTAKPQRAAQRRRSSLSLSAATGSPGAAASAMAPHLTSRSRRGTTLCLSPSSSAALTKPNQTNPNPNGTKRLDGGDGAGSVVYGAHARRVGPAWQREHEAVGSERPAGRLPWLARLHLRLRVPAWKGRQQAWGRTVGHFAVAGPVRPSPVGPRACDTAVAVHESRRRVRLLPPSKKKTQL